MKKCIAFLLAAVFGTGAGLAVSLAFQVAEVEDNTMLPSYRSGNKVVVSKWAYRFDGIGSGQERSPKRGDVVLLPNTVYTANGEGGVMMKRVAAVGGDQILITGGNVFVNNREIAEPYVFAEGNSGEMNPVEVPRGYVFVLGDNRAMSTDSRSETVGLVREDAILGKVIDTW